MQIPIQCIMLPEVISAIYVTVTTPTKISIKSLGKCQPGLVKTKLECWKWRYVLHDVPEKKNSPPSANQGLSKAKPRHHHTVCTIWVHPPISPCPAPPFLLTQRTLPEVIYVMKLTYISTIGPKKLS